MRHAITDLNGYHNSASVRVVISSGSELMARPVELVLEFEKLQLVGLGR